MIEFSYDLDIIPGGVPLVIPLKQNNTNFRLVFNLYARIGNFTIERGAKAVIRGLKPDGNVININADDFLYQTDEVLLSRIDEFMR